MIKYIKGILEQNSENSIVIENNGIGYNIWVSSQTLNIMPPRGSTVKIYTYLWVKEDDLSLYGFLTIEELNMFNLLITVSGVGPKGALSILSALSPSQAALAIVTDDVKSLSRGQGIGKKIAQRIALELKDKVKTESIVEMSNNLETEYTRESTGERQDAIEALISLGFNRSEAVKAVMETANDNMNSSEIIKLSLKRLSR